MSDYRVSLCVSVDFDAASFWFMLGSRNAHAISRGDYGAEVGTPRLLELFERLGIQTSWFIPGHTIDTYPDACAAVRDAGHEIGNHGDVHENFLALSPESARDALRRGNRAIERLTGSRPKGFRVTGDFKQELYPILLDEDFGYSSSLYGEHHARWAREPDQIGEGGRITRGNEINLVELSLNLAMTDLRYFEINIDPDLPARLVNPRQVEQVWRDEFDYMYERTSGTYTMMAVHPQVIGWGGRLLMFERFLSYCASKPGVRFTTAATLAAEFRAAESRRPDP